MPEKLEERSEGGGVGRLGPHRRRQEVEGKSKGDKLRKRSLRAPLRRVRDQVNLLVRSWLMSNVVAAGQRVAAECD